MVTIHSHPRRPSNTGSMGHSSSRTRRRSSLRRQSEKSAPTLAASVVARNNAQQRRTRSVSTGTSQHNQQQESRRPSAPAVVEMPRLSIADRFMALNYSSNPPLPPQPTLQPQQQQSGSPSISAASNSILHLSNSALSEMPTAGSNNKLSVADRFMSNSNKDDIDSTLDTQQQYRERSGSAYSEKTKTSGTTEPSFFSSSDPVPGRLTIANAFMKSSSIISPTPDTGRSRAASVADDLDMGVSNSRAKGGRKPSQVHPLETLQSKSTLFDDTATSHLNLDLNIASPSTSSSVLNHFDSVRITRPWGSQDTLVHPHLEKKKPIYAQFIDSEKDATIDHRSFSLGDYFLDAHSENKHETMTNDDRYLKHEGYEDDEDVEDSFQKHEKYYQHERHRDYEDDDEEKRSYYRDNHDKSPTNSTAKLNHNKKKCGNSFSSVNEEDEESRGFWVGCCFISCGKKPSRRIIEERQKQRQKQRRKKEIEQQQQESRPKNRGFGRRGWVFCTFLSLIVIVLISYFLWPRTPLIRIEGASLTSPAKITETRHGVMVGNVAFESEWLVNITVDNRQNRVPTRLVQVQILAKDALTGLVIGKGLHNDDPSPEHIVLAPNAISTIPIPIKIDYQARESTDTTFVNLNKACSQQSISSNTSVSTNKNANQRESLPLHFWITLHFFGLDWLNYKPTVIATPATGGFACPQS